MKITDLISTIHKSIHQANNDHANWTGGWWMQAYGVEGFLVSRIADGIMNHKNRPGYLTLETSFRELYENCKKMPKGKRITSTKDSNRIDIALYNRNDMLSHVVEVKRFWSPACYTDIDRLTKFYGRHNKSNEGSLKEALFVQLVAVSARRNPNTIEKRLSNYFDDISERCSNYVTKIGFTCQSYRGTDVISPIILEDRTEAFSSFCLRIRP